jgi:hypothetical protein
MPKIFLLLFISLTLYADDYPIISITTNETFNYFASLQIWLLIITAPMLLVIALFKAYRKVYL